MFFLCVHYYVLEIFLAVRVSYKSYIELFYQYLYAHMYEFFLGLCKFIWFDQRN